MTIPERNLDSPPSSQAGLAVPASATVLVVDDNPANLLALDVLIRELHFDVVLASSGSDALKKLLERTFVCALLDVRMPGIDGFETAALIRKRERTKDLPIIFMTSTEPSLLDYTQGYALGAVDFVTRPLASEILQGKVKAIAQMQLERENARRERDEATRESREHLVSIFEALPIAVWSTDDNLVVTYCGGALYGQGEVPPAETLIGKPLASLLKPQEGKEHPGLAAHKQALGGRAARYEDRADTRTFEMHVRPHRDAAGRIRGVLGAAVDVTERRRAQDELAAARADFARVTDAFPALISYIGPDGNYVFVNQAYQDWFGHPLSYFRGRHPREVLGAEAFESLRPHFEKALSGKTVAFETRVSDKDGTTRFVGATYVPHILPDGRVAGFVALVNDRSERHRREEAQAFLAEAASALASSLDALSTLRTVARLSVPRLADGCAIDLVSPEMKVDPVAVAHGNPAKQTAAPEFIRRRPVSLEDPRGIGAVLRSREAEIVPWIPDLGEQTAGWYPDEGGSVIIVPLQGPDRVLGAITFWTAESKRRYGSEDLALAQDLAQRVSLALGNASLVERVQKLNAELSSLVDERTRDLANNRSRYEVLSRISPVGIFQIDPRGDCVDVNRRWADIAGIEPTQARNQGWLSALHPEDRERVAREWYDATQQRRDFSSEYRFLRPDGKVTWVLGQSTELKDGQGTVTGYIGTITDITERRVREDLLRETSTKVEAVNQDLESFVHSVSHDLRTPLRGMSGMAELLLESYRGKVLDDEGQQYAERIVAASQRMDRMTQDLLAYSKVSRGDAPLETTDLDSILAEALKGMATEIANRKAEIECPTRLARASGSRILLQQVFQNLLDNAIKFVKPGVEPRVKIHGEDRGERVRICVEDNGIGIPLEDRQKLFRLFNRLHAQKDYPGTGIGLALVKRAVERMGGSVGVDPGKEGGSTFWFELPRGRQES